MTQTFDGSPFDVDPFDDPDRCVQVEDDNPEALAAEPVEFDSDADDEGGE